MLPALCVGNSLWCSNTRSSASLHGILLLQEENQQPDLLSSVDISYETCFLVLPAGIKVLGHCDLFVNQNWWSLLQLKYTAGNYHKEQNTQESGKGPIKCSMNIYVVHTGNKCVQIIVAQKRPVTSSTRVPGN